MMNTEHFKGSWNILKGKVKQKWGELTDDDLAEIDGNYDELVGKLQLRLGKSKDEAHELVDSLFES
jgi:uncharacterized protein YjbJ (UPF0337 family)